MFVVGFFRSAITSIANLVNFVSTPLKEINSDLAETPLGDISIVQALGVSLIATISILLVIHLIRLFVGG